VPQPALPSRPAKGDVLTPKVMRTVGCSTLICDSGAVTAGSAMVSLMLIVSGPAMATISPACAVSTSSRSRLW